MSEFEEAFYKEEKKCIDVHKYLDRLHYKNIYCPECFVAPLHIVRKQNSLPYFASNRKEDHTEDCQHYGQRTLNQYLSRLVLSDVKEDKERLEFLVQKDLQKTINQFYTREFIKQVKVENYTNNSQNSSIKTLAKEHKNKSILRVSIKNLLQYRNKYLDNYIIVWGNADVESSEKEGVNSTTKDKFKIKKLVFKVDNKFRFSISLTGSKLNYYQDLERSPMNINFAVFGQLIENNSYLELKVFTTKHLKFIV
jgi:hypothetical protein